MQTAVDNPFPHYAIPIGIVLQLNREKIAHTHQSLPAYDWCLSLVSIFHKFESFPEEKSYIKGSSSRFIFIRNFFPFLRPAVNQTNKLTSKSHNLLEFRTDINVAISIGSATGNHKSNTGEITCYIPLYNDVVFNVFTPLSFDVCKTLVILLQFISEMFQGWIPEPK